MALVTCSPRTRMVPSAGWRIVVCLGAGLALAGCGAGQLTQTAAQQAAVTGAAGDAGEISLRDVRFPYPADPTSRYPVGASVPLLATIINHGDEADELVAVTSPAASEVRLSGDTAIPAGKNLVLDADEADAAELVSPLVAGKLRVVLVTSQVLPAGVNTPVTFQFRSGGQVTLAVPMAEPPEFVPSSAGE